LGFLRKAISASHGNDSVTIVPKGACITGDLLINGALHINGEFDGLLDTQSMLMIGRGGVFKGRARAHEVMLSGLYEGELHCDRLHILKGGLFRGRVACEQFVLDEQAEFLGERIEPGSDLELIEEAQQMLAQPVPVKPDLTLDNLLDSLPTQVSFKDR